MACKPRSHSRKGKTVRDLMDVRGLTPGQRSKIEMKLSSQDRASLPAFLSPLWCLSGSQRMPGTGRNPWAGQQCLAVDVSREGWAWGIA